MRILHVITTLDVGGAEMHLLAQVGGQARRGHEVRVAWIKGGGSLAAELRAAGAAWVERTPPSARGLARLVAQMRWAERVHSHLLKADMASAVLASLAGRRRGLVSSKHNDERVLERAPVAWVHGLLGRLPRRTIVLSDHVGRFMERHGRVPRGLQRRIYYGIDPDPFERAAAMGEAERAELRASFGFGPADVVFLCVARFAPQKAHAVLLEAFERARRAAREDGLVLRLLLVGDDPFGEGRVRAEALARALDLGDSTVFAGIRRDVARLYGIADVFVLASLWEGLGLVFLEAMAARLPVVATRVSAVPEVVIDGETGLLAPSGDEAALAALMLALARDPERRRSLGQAGSRRVRERFGLERMVEETLAVYGSLDAR